MAARNASAPIRMSVTVVAPSMRDSGNLGMDPQGADEWPGLLGEWKTKPPERWTKAQLLRARTWDQEAIRALEAERDALRAQLAGERAKHARSERKHLVGLLAWDPPKKRGRPPGSKDMRLAMRAFAMQKAMRAQSPRRRVTREEALGATLQKDGRGAYRAKKMRGVLNEMSRLEQQEKHKKSLS